MTIQAKAERIIKDIKREKGNNPIQIFKRIADHDYINIHGPEHHILDGACLLVAFKNAGGEIDLDDALNKIMIEGLRMPGAMCVYGVYAVQSHHLVRHYHSLIIQGLYLQMVPGETIWNLLQTH